MKQEDLFENPKTWVDEWIGMPEFVQKKTEFHCIKVSFVTKEAMQIFSRLIEQNVDLDTKIIYYPFKLVDTAKGLKYIDDES